MTQPALADPALQLLSATPTAAFPYRLDHEVGRGSMGVVFRATEPSLERPVAIKVLRSEGFERARTATELDELRLRFLQEARSAAAIAHPGAVTIYRVGRVDGVPYIAMEWLDGETLATRLARLGRLGINEVVGLALQTLDVLATAHEAGVVHRDVKPANLIVLRDGRLKVADFGIAQFRRASLLETQAGVVLGTPIYASPEQLRGEAIDGRSDLFSLGVLLFEALTGRHPFLADASFAALLAGAHDRPPASLAALAPEVPAAVAQVIETALATDRARRWPSAAAMTAALRAAVGGPPVDAPTVPDLRAGASAMPGPEILPWHRDLPASPELFPLHVVAGWPGRELPSQSLERLLAKLLDRPLHAEPFAGGLRVGGALLLIAQGQILAALDVETGRPLDDVGCRVPDHGAATLHALPAGLPSRVVPALATLAQRDRSGATSLEGRLVEPTTLAAKLAEEHFDGLVRLRRGDREGFVVLCDGRAVLVGTSSGWPAEHHAASWPTWARALGAEVEVVPASARAIPESAAYELGDLELVTSVRDAATSTGSAGRAAGTLVRTAARLAQRAERRRPRAEISTADGVIPPALERAPAARLLRWLLERAPGFFAERNLGGKWKYLDGWIREIRRARLHHRLADAGGELGERFDLVTYDEKGKVLHLGLRCGCLTAARLEEAVARLIAAKTARLDTGDVGGAVIASPRIEEAAVDAYLRILGRRGKGVADLIDGMTGYAGFVRLGPRRGFHLLLVEETAGGFEPLLV